MFRPVAVLPAPHRLILLCTTRTRNASAAIDACYTISAASTPTTELDPNCRTTTAAHDLLGSHSVIQKPNVPSYQMENVTMSDSGNSADTV